MRRSQTRFGSPLEAAIVVLHPAVPYREARGSATRFRHFPKGAALPLGGNLPDNARQMSTDTNAFAPAPDEPIPYMQRTREYYRAIGYDTPYRWAHNSDTPFQPLKKPLAQSRVTIVTTAAPFNPAKGDQGPGAKYNGGAKFFQVYAGDTLREHDLRISHIAYDRMHSAAEDMNTWFPLPQLLRFAQKKRIEVAKRFFGLPTNRSQRVTCETDAPEILARCKEDKVDAAILVPNCPVCHQSVTLTARHLEANGISTVVMGCAKDIVEHAGAPRFRVAFWPLPFARRIRAAGGQAPPAASARNCRSRVSTRGHRSI
jgi:hypothetical protein